MNTQKGEEVLNVVINRGFGKKKKLSRCPSLYLSLVHSFSHSWNLQQPKSPKSQKKNELIKKSPKTV